MKKNDFEKDLKELEKIVEALSAGEKGLNDSIDLYKKGLELTKKCYQELEDSEKEVKILLNENGKIKEKKFK